MCDTSWQEKSRCSIVTSGMFFPPFTHQSSFLKLGNDGIPAVLSNLIMSKLMSILIKISGREK